MLIEVIWYFISKIKEFCTTSWHQRRRHLNLLFKCKTAFLAPCNIMNGVSVLYSNLKNIYPLLVFFFFSGLFGFALHIWSICSFFNMSDNVNFLALCDSDASTCHLFGARSLLLYVCSVARTIWYCRNYGNMNK